MYDTAIGYGLSGVWWEEEGERIIGLRILVAPSECIAGHPQRHLQALNTRQTRANQHNTYHTYNDPVTKHRTP